MGKGGRASERTSQGKQVRPRFLKRIELYGQAMSQNALLYLKIGEQALHSSAFLERWEESDKGNRNRVMRNKKTFRYNRDLVSGTPPRVFVVC